MPSAAAARDAIHRALELGVLETEDLRAAGFPGLEPAPLLEALAAHDLLAPPVAVALARLGRIASPALISLDEVEEQLSVRARVGLAVKKRRKTAAPGCDDPEDAESLLRLLDAADRRAIEEAAWCRAAIRLGVATRSEIASVPDGTDRLEDRLVARGVVSADAAMSVFVVRCKRRPACRECFAVLESAPPQGAPCPACGAPPPASGRVPTLGSETVELPGKGGTFAGYELLERVAEGGMGIVFKARQPKTGRIVALKVMRDGRLAGEKRRRRFLLEAEAAASLKHRGIVPVHEIGEAAGHPYYTMDFVEGEPLNAHAARRRFPPRQIARLVREVADAVHHFHLHGIIHRDLKPENILVAADDVPRIIDFGIAKKLGDSSSSTVDGDVLGTLHYMSPEQAGGHQVDIRTDVYALGTILYELATGAPAFDALDGARLLIAIQAEEPPSIRAARPDIDADFEAIVEKAMAKERERRYQSAADLAADLDAYDHELPIGARPATLAYRIKKTIKRRIPVAIGVGVSLAFTSIGLGVWSWGAYKLRREVAALLAAAEEPGRSDAEREKLLERAVFKAPGDERAQARLDFLVAQRKAAETHAHEQERQKRELLEERLARELAEKEADAALQRDRLRTEAEKETRLQACAKARVLLEQAERESTDLGALHLLSEAIAVVPAGEPELVARIEERKIELSLRVARRALADDQSGLAAFWLEEVRKLGRASSHETELADLGGAIADVARGRRDLEQARALLRAGDLLGARGKLEQARARGAPAGEVAKESAIVATGCSERARSLTEDGRASLRRGDPAGGLARGSQALRFVPGYAEAVALAADCEDEIVADAKRSAAALWARDERRQALAALEQATRLVKDPRRSAALVRERAARAALLDDDSLARLVFVPEVPELGIEPFYIQATEVTNADFQEFLVATAKDGSPRDPANADRPVRGVGFHEARAYARWLSTAKGARWRLPRDREWEAAAGWDPAASRLRRYPWGDELVSALALGAKAPGPAGQAKGDCSALGLLDAGGNVREWVERRGELPGTKGADYACDESAARYYAQVKTTGMPDAAPSAELLKRIGFRLVREIEVER